MEAKGRGKIGGGKEKEKQYEVKKNGEVQGMGTEREKEKLLANTVHTLPYIGTVANFLFDFTSYRLRK